MISGIGNIGSMPMPTAVTRTSATQAAPGGDFSQVLSSFATDTVDALKAGEAASIGGIQGTVPTQDVVSAVMNAEQALQTAVAIRDKLVSAYQEISRMAI